MTSQQPARATAGHATAGHATTGHATAGHATKHDAVCEHAEYELGLPDTAAYSSVPQNTQPMSSPAMGPRVMALHQVRVSPTRLTSHLMPARCSRRLIHHDTSTYRVCAISQWNTAKPKHSHTKPVPNTTVWTFHTDLSKSIHVPWWPGSDWFDWTERTCNRADRRFRSANASDGYDGRWTSTPTSSGYTGAATQVGTMPAYRP